MAEQWDMLFGLDESQEQAPSIATTKESKTKATKEQMKNKKNFWSWMLHAAACASDFANPNSKGMALGRGLRRKSPTDQSSTPQQSSPRSGFLLRQQDFRRESALMKQQRELDAQLKMKKSLTRDDVLRQFGGNRAFNGDTGPQNGKKGNIDKAQGEHRRENHLVLQTTRHAGDNGSDSGSFGR